MKSSGCSLARGDGLLAQASGLQYIDPLPRFKPVDPETAQPFVFEVVKLHCIETLENEGPVL